LKALGLIDKIVAEPLGGAHRDVKQMAALLKRALADSLRQFQGHARPKTCWQRAIPACCYGKFKETTPDGLIRVEVGAAGQHAQHSRGDFFYRNIRTRPPTWPAALARVRGGCALVVAFSGGRDSATCSTSRCACVPTANAQLRRTGGGTTSITACKKRLTTGSSSAPTSAGNST